MAKHERIHLDVDDKELLTSLSIGDKVDIRIRGEVKSVSAPYEYDEEVGRMGSVDKNPGSISLEISKRTIKKGGNVFSELEEDESED